MTCTSRGLSRRQMVGSLACGSLLFPGALSELLAAESGASASDPLASCAPHIPPRAKRVIYLFMTGGVSHLESFDFKPKLEQDAGKKHKGRTLLGPQFKFSRAGQSGIAVSEL